MVASVIIMAMSAMMAFWLGPAAAAPYTPLAPAVPAVHVTATATTAAAAAATTTGLEEFIARENKIALQGIFNNIGPNGTLVPGAPAGMVEASPSTYKPDCKCSPSAFPLRLFLLRSCRLPLPLTPYAAPLLTEGRFLHMDKRRGPGTEDAL